MKDENGAEDLKPRTKRYALRIIKMFTALPQNDVARVLGKQVLRSATSVGANYHEGCRRQNLTLRAGETDYTFTAVAEKRGFTVWLCACTNDSLPDHIHYDKLTEMQKQDISRFVALVKTKQVPVSNEDMMKPADVVKRVQTALGDPKITCGAKQVNRFNENIHAKCWRFFKVRPPGKSQTPSDTTPKYCVYDKPHNDYLYTQAWVDFLVEKLKDEAFFQTFYKKVPETPPQPVSPPAVG